MSGFGRSITDEESRLTFLNGEVGKVEKRLEEVQSELSLAEENYAKKLAEFDAIKNGKVQKQNVLTSELESLKTIGKID